MSLARFGVQRPVVANLTMFALLLGGLVFGVGLRREFFPEINSDMVTVTAPYPGASPDEVESALAVKIEDALKDVDDIKEIRTTAAEGLASITVEFLPGTDIDERLFEIKRIVDALQDLPEEAERIVVTKIEPNLPTINLLVTSEDDWTQESEQVQRAQKRALKDAINSIRDDLESLPDMGTLVRNGARTDEIRVRVHPDALQEHGLDIPEVAARIRQSMIDLPAGAVRTPTETINIRTIGADDRVSEVRDIVVKSSPGGQVLRLHEIADIDDDFVDQDLYYRSNGKPAMGLMVLKKGDQDIVQIAEMVKAYIAGRNGDEFKPSFLDTMSAQSGKPSPRMQAYQLGQSRAEVPLPGMLSYDTDLARFVVGRLNLLTRNAIWGAALVFLTLMLFLSWRASFWVLVGLIVSMAATLMVMHFIGQTLNLLTMFGLIIVLGLLVDDAIVVAENIASRHESGESPLQAAIKGTEQVGWPVVATVVTSVVAFLPFTVITGRFGDMIGVLPVVVACALLVSLGESLFILPVHMGHSLETMDRRRARGKHSRLDRIEMRMDAVRASFFQKLLIPTYEKLLRWCLRARYLTLAIAAATLVFSLGLVGGGRVKFTMMETNDSETVNISLRMAVGTPVTVTDSMIRRIERIAGSMPEVSSISTSVGAVGAMDMESVDVATHIGQVVLELVPIEQRDRTSVQVRSDIRSQLGVLAGVRELRLEEIQGGPDGPPITLSVVGEDEESIKLVVEDMKRRLNEFAGVRDISDDSDAGARELRISLLPGANELGFTTENVARQIRGAVFGLEAHTFPGDRESVDVRVTLPDEQRRSLAEIERSYVRSPAGDLVPLAEIASLSRSQAYATIRRLDGKRVVTVTADIDDNADVKPEQVMAELRPQYAEAIANVRGVSIVERGKQKDFIDAMSSLPIGMLIACVLIYVVLAWLFQSYLQPIIVMTAIPFAIIGVVWGHLLMGYTMTFLSLVGFMALSGIVVNDSLILMEFINHAYRVEGKSLKDACIGAGTARIRAILLTTLTTVAGLLPMMLEQSFQAQFLIPMAITISFGLLSSTLLLLVVLPCLLLIFQDVKRIVVGLWTGDRDLIMARTRLVPKTVSLAEIDAH
ncbi:MAG: efflux RND transporter permease subunit [Phycisphaeraceae bacterium]|nr:efflux RND transporter permease subunit [Phycisphaerales bacterium]MCB9859909.1 efflux RND transporter permease subunit [Phycisphaeraceae bacterium]